jgi:hypothetical protein
MQRLPPCLEKSKTNLCEGMGIDVYSKVEKRVIYYKIYGHVRGMNAMGLSTLRRVFRVSVEEEDMMIRRFDRKVKTKGLTTWCSHAA